MDAALGRVGVAHGVEDHHAVDHRVDDGPQEDGRLEERPARKADQEEPGDETQIRHLEGQVLRLKSISLRSTSLAETTAHLFQFKQSHQARSDAPAQPRS